MTMTATYCESSRQRAVLDEGSDVQRLSSLSQLASWAIDSHDWDALSAAYDVLSDYMRDTSISKRLRVYATTLRLDVWDELDRFAVRR